MKTGRVTVIGCVVVGDFEGRGQQCGAKPMIYNRGRQYINAAALHATHPTYCKTRHFSRDQLSLIGQSKGFSYSNVQ